MCAVRHHPGNSRLRIIRAGAMRRRRGCLDQRIGGWITLHRAKRLRQIHCGSGHAHIRHFLPQQLRFRREVLIDHWHHHLQARG